MDFIMDNLGTICVLIVVGGIITAVIAGMVKDKKAAEIHAAAAVRAAPTQGFAIRINKLRLLRYRIISDTLLIFSEAYLYFFLIYMFFCASPRYLSCELFMYFGQIRLNCQGFFEIKYCKIITVVV